MSYAQNSPFHSVREIFVCVAATKIQNLPVHIYLYVFVILTEAHFVLLAVRQF